MVTVSPELPGQAVNAYRSSIEIVGNSVGRTTYTVTLSDDLTDVFGQALGGDRSVEIDVGPALPSLQGFDRQFVTLDPMAETKGVPVVPGGIRFPGHQGDGPLAETEPMEIEFGPAMKPPVVAEKPKRKDLLAFHGAIMQEIARLSGKSWQADSSRRKSCLEQNIST